MTIKVRFFAALRERLGTESLDVPASSSVDVEGLLALIRRQLGEGAVEILSAPNVRIALNQEFVTDQCRISDGDEIAFMPPITGG
jgi:molybdopterin synthase sulfur carrier subunit